MANAIWQATIVDQAGSIQPGAEVEVVDEATGLPATLFTTRAGTAQSNPFFADANGFAQFYAAPGLYRITATSGGTGTTMTWRYVVLVDDVAQKTYVDAELQTKLTAGDLVQVTGQSTTDVMSQKAVSDQLLGVGQTWQNMNASRVLDTTYTNSTGRTIIVTVVGISVTVGLAASVRLTIDGLGVDFCQITADTSTTNAYPNVSAAVPHGSSYMVTVGANPANIYYWRELR